MPFDRTATLAHVRAQPEIPVLIIGGGINGAGVLRELALQGVDALLVERGDFAGGATAASSRMIHGGLRYLENGEFRLVREALRERDLLLKNAPHAVRPLPTVIPLFTRATGFVNAALRFVGLSTRPTRRGEWLVRAGLRMYERYAGTEHALPHHRLQSGDEARRDRPLLHPAARAIATYFDAWNPLPERLCLEVLDDATRQHAGARALNYVSVTGSAPEGTVVLCDEGTGERLPLRPRVVINATGAWIDATDGALGERTAWIGGTKGSHIVVDHPELYAQLGGSEIFYENADGRICLILPVNGRVLIGATDIRVDDPDAARCDDDEVAYLLGAVRQVFPSLRLEPAHILARLCGVRPLPRSGHAATGRISRDHALREIPPAGDRTFTTLVLVGGKWTTFRAFAAQAADRALALLGRQRRISSEDLVIGGGRDFPHGASTQDMWFARHAARTGVDRAIIARLFERHGTTAARIAAHMAAMPRESRAFDSIGPCFAGELDWIAREEAVVHLDDLVLRRTPLALFGFLDATRLQRAGTIAAAALAWDAGRTQHEVDRCARLLRERHGIDLTRSIESPRRHA
ncbi:MAG: glycerol-3-phosphate dehydrogenase/oxidase [Opitutaceae bacterium]|nr:glycerol-3-phosphate dehydrogenase/oxidase [Opitutaceae bacterium]